MRRTEWVRWLGEELDEDGEAPVSDDGGVSRLGVCARNGSGRFVFKLRVEPVQFLLKSILQRTYEFNASFDVFSVKK